MSQKTSHLPSTPKGKKALQAFTPLALSLAAASSANAAIVYAPLDRTFGTTRDVDATFDINIFGDAANDLEIKFNQTDSSSGTDSLKITGTNGNNQFNFFVNPESTFNFGVRFLENNPVQGEQRNAEVVLGADPRTSTPISANDTWLPAAGASRTGYIGFTFKDGPDADDPIYRGWMKVSVRTNTDISFRSPERLTLHAWAYNDEAGQPITAGQGVPVPESSTTAGALGLLALGAAYRLRKRQG